LSEIMNVQTINAVEDLFYRLIPVEDQAQLVIYSNGKKVVDIAGEIDQDSVTGIFSVSKALCAIALAKLVDEEKLNVNEKVCRYWPEFASAGKENITVRQLLSHQAGLVETEAGLTIEQLHTDHEAAAMLANTAPLWEPGSAFGYHATTIGILISELIFRITGMSVQIYYEREIRSKLNVDAYLGLPLNIQHKFLQPLPANRELPLPAKNSLSEKAWWQFANAMRRAGGIDTLIYTPERLAFGGPAFGGVASARGLAAVFNWATGFGEFSSGVSSKTIYEFANTHVHGFDVAQLIPDRRHGLVFMKPTKSTPFGSASAFGHDGAGGSIVFADPETRIVFAYVVRRLTFPGGVDQRIYPILQLIQSSR